MQVALEQLVESDLSEFLFERLRELQSDVRIQDADEALVVQSVQVLRMLSVIGDKFVRHFVFGFDVVIRWLDTCIQSGFRPLQAEIMALLSKVIAVDPASVPLPSAQKLTQLISIMVEQDKDSSHVYCAEPLDGIAIADNRNVSLNCEEAAVDVCLDIYSTCCQVLTSLLSCNVDLSLSLSLESTLSALAEALTPSEQPLTESCPTGTKPFRLMTLLLKSASQYFQRAFTDKLSAVLPSRLQPATAAAGHPFVRRPQSQEEGFDLLLQICDIHLLPCFILLQDDLSRRIEDEHLVLLFLEALAEVFRHSSRRSAIVHAKKLARAFWFRLGYEIMDRFGVASIRRAMFEFFADLVDYLLDEGYGNLLRGAATQLPPSPEDALAVAEEDGSKDEEVAAAQLAVLLLFYAGMLYDNRIVDSMRLLSSIEKHILINRRRLKDDQPNVEDCIRFILFLYVSAKRDVGQYAILQSNDAETALTEILLSKHFRKPFPCMQTNEQHVLIWLLKKEELLGFNMWMLESWISKAHPYACLLLGNRSRSVGAAPAEHEHTATARRRTHCSSHGFSTAASTVTSTSASSLFASSIRPGAAEDETTFAASRGEGAVLPDNSLSQGMPDAADGNCIEVLADILSDTDSGKAAASVLVALFDGVSRTSDSEPSVSHLLQFFKQMCVFSSAAANTLHVHGLPDVVSLSNQVERSI
ncbi:hypothetical protein CBR_g39378 [Chara braunii]|uniref:Uncharacterized protein n=1 Tax=Chara braunii TaxID=69332 RepID=A0A388LRI1_CHABU|nr:hypothetical protein CBR_g39378 [Chara braunii]|eukprot:GBG84917.1 hypothetical protein CBR_g39378 [Chara braunii]